MTGHAPHRPVDMASFRPKDAGQDGRLPGLSDMDLVRRLAAAAKTSKAALHRYGRTIRRPVRLIVEDGAVFLLCDPTGHDPLPDSAHGRLAYQRLLTAAGEAFHDLAGAQGEIRARTAMLIDVHVSPAGASFTLGAYPMGHFDLGADLSGLPAWLALGPVLRDMDRSWREAEALGFKGYAFTVPGFGAPGAGGRTLGEALQRLAGWAKAQRAGGLPLPIEVRAIHRVGAIQPEESSSVAEDDVLAAFGSLGAEANAALLWHPLRSTAPSKASARRRLWRGPDGAIFPRPVISRLLAVP